MKAAKLSVFLSCQKWVGCFSHKTSHTEAISGSAIMYGHLFIVVINASYHHILDVIQSASNLLGI